VSPRNPAPSVPPDAPVRADVFGPALQRAESAAAAQDPAPAPGPVERCPVLLVPGAESSAEQHVPGADEPESTYEFTGRDLVRAMQARCPHAQGLAPRGVYLSVRFQQRACASSVWPEI